MQGVHETTLEFAGTELECRVLGDYQPAEKRVYAWDGARAPYPGCDASFDVERVLARPLRAIPRLGGGWRHEGVGEWVEFPLSLVPAHLLVEWAEQYCAEVNERLGARLVA